MLAAALLAFFLLARTMAGAAPAHQPAPAVPPAFAADAPPAAGAPAAGVAPPPQPVPGIEVFRSKRGGVKALCEGYSYRLARYHKDGTAVFRCDREESAARRRGHGEGGRLLTTEGASSNPSGGFTTPHGRLLKFGHAKGS